MASTLEFVQYVVDQLSAAGSVTYKKMFGEYGLYLDGKYFACVCDNCLFVKITRAGKSMMPAHQTGLPYEGAKPMFLIEGLEDAVFLAKLARATCLELPAPKPKRRPPKGT